MRRWPPSCARQQTGKLFPRRILDLRDGRVVLKEGIGGPEFREYACLSHRWGTDGETTQTTPESIEQHKFGIHDLTPTFRDAVNTCRRLGIDFLWIDSLCIIQGDKADWARESSLMADIYAMAYLTIAATWSYGGLKGRLYRKYPRRFRSHPVPGHDGLFTRERFSHLRSTPDEHDPSQTVLTKPLISRAWVYQEMYLSRRTIHFVLNEVEFECHSGRWSESGDGDRDVSDRRGGWLIERADGFEDPLLESKDVYEDLWHDLASQ